MEYGVQVDNKFAFGSDDELGDPSDLLKLSIQEKRTPAQKKAERDAAKKAKAKEEADRKAAAAAAAAIKEERPANADRGRGGPRGRGGRGRGDGPRPPRTDRGEGGDSPTKDGQGEFRGGRGRGRGAPRGDRPFRGGRGGGPRNTNESNNGEEPKEIGDENTPPLTDGVRRGRGGFGRGRGTYRGGRQFDRQSGSEHLGVRPQEKKEGHGKGNWGTTEDALDGETEEVKVEEQESPQAPREKTAEELEREAREAEEAKFKTLAEYRASLHKEETKFNTRKAGEGSEDNFGKLVPLARKEIPEDDGHEVIVQGKESKKKLVEVNIRFADQGREHRGNDRSDRGDRGRGGRGRSGRGGHFSNRGGAPRSSGHRYDNQFKADLRNDEEFPTLA